MATIQPTTRRRRLALFIGAVAVVWLLVMLVGGDSGALAMFNAKDRHSELVGRVQALERDNERLRAEIERLSSDPGTIERLAREELQMARPGEEVILVRDARPATSPTP